jgi:hypothetical protein
VISTLVGAIKTKSVGCTFAARLTDTLFCKVLYLGFGAPDVLPAEDSRIEFPMGGGTG